MDGTEGVRAGETCEWREQASHGDWAGGSRDLRVTQKAASTGRQTGQRTGAPGRDGGRQKAREARKCTLTGSQDTRAKAKGFN